jgi:hypothetical protein
MVVTLSTPFLQMLEWTLLLGSLSNCRRRRVLEKRQRHF